MRHTHTHARTRMREQQAYRDAQRHMYGSMVHACMHHAHACAPCVPYTLQAYDGCTSPVVDGATSVATQALLYGAVPVVGCVLLLLLPTLW